MVAVGPVPLCCFRYLWMTIPYLLPDEASTPTTHVQKNVTKSLYIVSDSMHIIITRGHRDGTKHQILDRQNKCSGIYNDPPFSLYSQCISWTCTHRTHYFYIKHHHRNTTQIHTYIHNTYYVSMYHEWILSVWKKYSFFSKRKKTVHTIKWNRIWM